MARRLLALPRPGMLVLLDRGFDAATFLTAVHRTGAMPWARARSQRVPPVLEHLLDGSYLSDLDGLAVRIIELWALLTLYQLLRMAVVSAVETRPGTDPDPASVTSALEAAREQLSAARGSAPTALLTPLGPSAGPCWPPLPPARRPRYNARKVKCATPRYLNRDDDRPSTPTTISALDIATHPTLDLTPKPRRYRPRSTPRPDCGGRNLGVRVRRGRAHGQLSRRRRVPVMVVNMTVGFGPQVPDLQLTAAG